VMDNHMTENEIDHVFVGETEQEAVSFNPDEVEDYKWMSSDELHDALLRHPTQYSPWLAQALKLALNFYSGTED
jgi:isopentenyl-diphosphate delta-isomerase